MVLEWVRPEVGCYDVMMMLTEKLNTQFKGIDFNFETSWQHHGLAAGNRSRPTV